jgi:sugar (pentulose or hexulose) kinase
VYLGIDLGASGVKAVLVTGAIVATWRRNTSALSWLLEITGRVVKRIEPQPGSGRQELLENIVNRYVWRPYRIQALEGVREESS